jgi:hypothetical protein
MSPVLTSLTVFACVFGSGLLGMAVRGALPEHHSSGESKELIRAIMALIGTMSALVLGLLVASAKSTYDGQRDELTRSVANVVLLDRVLAQYGPESAPVRQELRSAVSAAADRMFQPPSKRPAAFLGSLYQAVSSLPASSETQRALKATATSLLLELGRSRWLLFARNASTVSVPLLVAVVFWLSISFLSFGLFAKQNLTVVAALFLGALSVGGAIFLIVEMDSPFEGLLRLSDAPIRAALEQLGR